MVYVGRMKCSPPWLLVGLLLCGCGYDPPMQADHASAAYQADLAACQTTAHAKADELVKRRVYLWVSYPVSLPIEQRAQTRVCLQGKGYNSAK